MNRRLAIDDQAARHLLSAADMLSELGRTDSDYELLRIAADCATAEQLRRLLQYAEQRSDIGVAQQALRHLIRELSKTATPAAERELLRLRGSDLMLLDVLENLSSASEPVIPISNRLLYILHHSRPYLSNGYATRGHGLARGMVDAGLDVICLTRPGFPLDVKKELRSAPDKDLIDNVVYMRDLAPKRSGPGRSRTYILDAAKVLEERIRKHRPQAVMVASNYVAAVPALIAARKAGIPISYEVRGFWEVTEASRDPSFVDSFSYKMKVYLETLCASLSDHVFTLSSAMEDELFRRGVDRKKISLLPNSCDPNSLRPKQRDPELAEEFNIPHNVPVIGYIGSFVDYEGLDDLAVACGRLRLRGYNFRLVLVGSTDGATFERIIEIAEHYRLSEWLILPGRVPHEDVEKWYSLIDIAPFPRKPVEVSELVTPIKPLEAMAMEKAVVVSSVRAMADMVQDNITGLVFRKGDLGDLENCLARLIDNPHLRAEIGQNSRTFIKKERTWIGMGRKVKDWLHPQT